MGQSKQVEGNALLDTGSLPGNSISRNCLVRMNALPYIYTSPVPMTVCSGLDRTCYLGVNVVDIGNFFQSHDDIMHTVYFTINVNPDQEIDLIVGRTTLALNSFNILTPSALGFKTPSAPQLLPLAAKKPVSDKPDKPPKDYSRQTAKAKPLTFKVIASTPAVAEPKTLPVHTSGKLNPSQRKKAAKERAKLAEKIKAKYGPAPSNIDHVVASLVPDTNTQPIICSPDCKCAAHNGLADRPARGNEGRQLPGNVVAALAVRTDETPRPGVDLPHTPSNTPLTESEDILHPICAKPSGIIVSIDEIDNEKVDTFGTFFSNNKDLHRVEDNNQAFLQQFVFRGSEN